MSAESDGLMRLLEEIAGRLTAIRHDERKASKAVEALLALFRAYQRRGVHAPPLLGPPPVLAPSPEQIRRFLRCFEILTEFDITQRFIRGYGAGFDAEHWPTRPDPDVVVVREWLERLADYPVQDAKRTLAPPTKPVACPGSAAHVLNSGFDSRDGGHTCGGDDLK